MHYDYKTIFSIEDEPYPVKDMSFVAKKHIGSYIIMQKYNKNSDKYKLLKEKLKKLFQKTQFLDESSSIIKREENPPVDFVRPLEKSITKSVLKKPLISIDPPNLDSLENMTISISEPDMRVKSLFSNLSQPKLLKKDSQKISSADPHQRDPNIPQRISSLSKKKPPTQAIPPSSKPKKKRRFRLKLPKHHKPVMQDFNDYYSHYSEEDMNEVFSEEISEESEQEEAVNEPISEVDLTGKNELNEQQKSNEENCEIEDIEGEKKDALTVGLNLRKEVSFHPSEKSNESPKLTPGRKKTSVMRQRTINKGGSHEGSPEKKDSTSVGKRESSFFPAKVAKGQTPENPYIGIIEKLLKSEDLFSEDVEGMMGIKKLEVNFPPNFALLPTEEKKIYEKLFTWSSQMDNLLRQDKKEMKLYKKRMERFFEQGNDDDEEEEEDISSEDIENISSGSEDEEIEEN